MSRRTGAPSFQLPQVSRWIVRVLYGLAAIYVMECVLRAAGVPVDALKQSSWASESFAWWQLCTRFWVQGSGGGVFFNVLLGLLVLYFLLPALEDILDRDTLRSVTWAVMGGALAFPLFLEFTGWVPGGPQSGWTPLLTGLIALFGLARPNALLYLFFVLPLPGWLFVWGSLVLAGWSFMVLPSSVTAEPVGAWMGAMGWWQLRGPPARRRHLLNEAQKVEQQLARFEVLDGGLGDQNRGPDSWEN
jgi:hypothetical protein